MPDQMQSYTLAPRRARSGPDPLLSFLQQAQGRPVVLSVAEVERIDSLRLRILLSAQALWAKEGIAFALAHVTDTFRDGLSRLGLSPAHFAVEER